MATPQQVPAALLAQTQQPTVIAGNTVTYSIAVLCVALRFWARRMTKQPWWFDDWLILGAVTFGAICYGIILYWIVGCGLGLHYEAISEPYLTIVYNNILNLFIGEIFYTMTTALIKVSVLAFYWRIFKITSIQLPIKIMSVIVACWTLARTLTIVFHCMPVEAYWDKTITDATCTVNDREFFLGTNTINLLMDVAILSLPMRYIKQLQIKKSMKVVVAGIFLMGGFVCIASIMYLVVSYRLDMNSPDITWTFSPIVLWAGVEMNLGVISACLPSLRPIFLFITRGRANTQGNWHVSNTAGTAGSKSNPGFRSNKGLFSNNRPSGRHHPFSALDVAEDGSITQLAKEEEWGSKGDVIVTTSGIPLDQVEPAHTAGGIGVRKDVQVEYA